MVGWHPLLNGHEFEQTPGDSEGRGSLMYCSPWGSQRVRQDLATEQQKLNNGKSSGGRMVKEKRVGGGGGPHSFSRESESKAAHW